MSWEEYDDKYYFAATTARITSGSTATTLSTEDSTSSVPMVFRIPLHRGKTSLWRRRVSGSGRAALMRGTRKCMKEMWY